MRNGFHFCSNYSSIPRRKCKTRQKHNAATSTLLTESEVFTRRRLMPTTGLKVSSSFPNKQDFTRETMKDE